MRVLHVVAGLAPAQGGPSYSVPRLSEALIGADCDTALFTIGESPADLAVTSFPQILSRTPILSSLKMSPMLRRTLSAKATEADVIHNHGLWLMPNVYAGEAARRTGRQLVVSPRGMLAPGALQFSRLKKRIFWALLQRAAFAEAAAWHATCLEEAEDIRSFGIKAPIAIIRNGIDEAPLLADHNPRRKKRTALFLSRIHPKKGLSNLIAAWSKIAMQRPLWELVIAGPDEGAHRAELAKQVKEIGATSIHFADPVYGAEKASLLASADLFILPTRSENFGIAVAEALAAGLPAIVTKGAPWSGLASQGCGWWIDHGIDPLKAALLEATALPADERQKMGVRGRAWMVRDFGWDAIGREMASVYRWIAGYGDCPTCIYDG